MISATFHQAVWPHSGHYRPTEENFKDFVSFLKENNVDLTDVQMSPVDEDEVSLGKQRSSIHRRSSSEEDLTQKLSGSETEDINAEGVTQEQSALIEEETATTLELPRSSRLHSLNEKLANLEIPNMNGFYERLDSENRDVGPSCESLPVQYPVDGYETAEESFPSEQDCMVPSENLSSEQPEESEVEFIPQESILKRINSHKGMNSYQLGKQLSFKWTTGAGPRIGCVKDYPSKLRVQALEQLDLSPRSAARSKSYLSPRLSKGMSPRVSTPASVGGEAPPTTPALEKGTFSQGINHHSRPQSSPLVRGISVPASANLF